MTLRERCLGLAVAATRPLLPALGLASPRLARAAAERRGVVARLAAWAAADRDPALPLLWLHGASAGELTGAAAVLTELRGRRHLQVLVTYFSPSAEPVLGRLAPDHADVLPLDTPREVRRALAAAEPDALVFAKGDVWPNLTRAARERGVPMGLVNGTVDPASSRLRRPARWLLAPAYGRLDRAGAASRGDARRLARLGVREDALAVTGDASTDWALERARRAADDPGSPAGRLAAARPGGLPRLVAGSTWRDDEEVLLGAASSLREAGTPLDLVLVPHDPEPEALDFVARRSRELLGLEPALWSEVVSYPEPSSNRFEEGPGAEGRQEGREAPGRASPGSPPPPLVVDEVGILAELYPAADVAWVGGGLGEAGLHSVVEPAAAGVPVLFGARSTRREARALVERGGGRALAPDAVAGALAELAADARLRREMGRAALACVEEEAGAAAASADLVEALLEGRP